MEQEYEDIIKNCQKLVEQSEGNALQKLELVFKTYRSSYVDPSLDAYLHMPQNAAIHQKSLAKILLSLSQVVSNIMEQGIRENLFICEYPQEYSEILLSVFTFLLDPGIFAWTKEQYVTKLAALANILEKGLCTPKDSFAFLYSA